MKTSLRAVSAVVGVSLLATSTGCWSSAERISTDRTYLLAPHVQSEPGPPTRDVTVKAVDTKGVLGFHVDRARECKVTSTPRYQTVHVEGVKTKWVASSIIYGSLATAGGVAVMVVSPYADEDRNLAVDNNSGGSDLTGAGWLFFGGAILAITGLVTLPRGIYHAAISGTETTGGEIQLGLPPKDAVLAPPDYNPEKPTVALSPMRPQYDVMAFGSLPAGEVKGIPSWAKAQPAAPPEEAQASIRQERQLELAASEPVGRAAMGVLAIPQDGSVSDDMRECVSRYASTCQAKCSGSRQCLLECLRKQCVENAGEEGLAGAPVDDKRYVITKKEVCERSGEQGVGISVSFRDMDGVTKTVELGRTDKSGDMEGDVLEALKKAYPGYPESSKVVLEEAFVLRTEEPSTPMTKFNLSKFSGLRYAEHKEFTKKQRELLAQQEAARKEKEEKARQAALEAAAKAAEDAQMAEQRKAEAQQKAAACAAQHRNKCSVECQGNQVCVKKCLQRPPSCK